MTITLICLAILWALCGLAPTMTWKLSQADPFTLLDLICCLIFGIILGPIPMLLMACHRVVLRKGKSASL